MPLTRTHVKRDVVQQPRSACTATSKPTGALCSGDHVELCCRTMAPGIEYVLTFVQEPSLYVIKRQYRTSPESAIQQAFYYCLHGDIFQAPTLLACLQARMERCKFHIEEVFDNLKSDLEPLGWRTRHRNRKIKRAKRQHDTAAKSKGIERKTLDDERLDIEIARAAVDNEAIELNTAAAGGTGLENELEHEGVRQHAHIFQPHQRHLSHWCATVETLVRAGNDHGTAPASSSRPPAVDEANRQHHHECVTEVCIHQVYHRCNMCQLLSETWSLPSPLTSTSTRPK